MCPLSGGSSGLRGLVVQRVGEYADFAAALTEGLRQAGLPGPQVGIRPVTALDRDPMTGKARRFVPLRLPQVKGAHTMDRCS